MCFINVKHFHIIIFYNLFYLVLLILSFLYLSLNLKSLFCSLFNSTKIFSALSILFSLYKIKSFLKEESLLNLYSGSYNFNKLF